VDAAAVESKMDGISGMPACKVPANGIPSQSHMLKIAPCHGARTEELKHRVSQTSRSRGHHNSAASLASCALVKVTQAKTHMAGQPIVQGWTNKTLLEGFYNNDVDVTLLHGACNEINLYNNPSLYHAYGCSEKEMLARQLKKIRDNSDEIVRSAIAKWRFKLAQQRLQDGFETSSGTVQKTPVAKEASWFMNWKKTSQSKEAKAHRAALERAAQVRLCMRDKNEDQQTCTRARTSCHYSFSVQSRRRDGRPVTLDKDCGACTNSCQKTCALCTPDHDKAKAASWYGKYTKEEQVRLCQRDKDPESKCARNKDIYCKYAQNEDGSRRRSLGVYMKGNCMKTCGLCKDRTADEEMWRKRAQEWKTKTTAAAAAKEKVAKTDERRQKNPEAFAKAQAKDAAEKKQKAAVEAAEKKKKAAAEAAAEKKEKTAAAARKAEERRKEAAAKEGSTKFEVTTKKNKKEREEKDKASEKRRKDYLAKVRSRHRRRRL